MCRVRRRVVNVLALRRQGSRKFRVADFVVAGVGVGSKLIHGPSGEANRGHTSTGAVSRRLQHRSAATESMFIDLVSRCSGPGRGECGILEWVPQLCEQGVVGPGHSTHTSLTGKTLNCGLVRKSIQRYQSSSEAMSTTCLPVHSV